MWKSLVAALLTAWFCSLFAQSDRDLDLVRRPTASVQDQQFSKRGGSRKALVVGNDSYQTASQLKNARNDARSIAAVLKKSGFSVFELEDADAAKLESGISDFFQSTLEGDIVFFFYAGHGMQIDQVNYLVPIDVKTRDEIAMKQTCYNVDQIVNHLEASGARLSVVVIDACRSNPFRRTRSLNSGLAPMDVRLGTVIVFSAGPGQAADDNLNGLNGLFTKHLVSALQEPGNLIDAFRKTRELVYEESKGAQRPWIHEDVIGDFSLSPQQANKPAVSQLSSPPSPAAADDPVAKGQQLYNRGDYRGAAEAFELARRRNPDDPFVHNAAAAAYLNLGQVSRSIELLKTAISIRPNYTAAYYNRGLAFMKNGQYRLAIEDFSWSIEDDPFNPVLFNVRGKAYFAQRDYDRALTDLSRSIELNATDPTPFYWRGQVYHRTGEFDKALSDYNYSISLGFTSLAIYDYRALTKQALGDDKGADQDRQRAAELRREGKS